MNEKRNPNIVHIHVNSAGNSGLYVHQIFNALESIGEQTIFVNKYYPFGGDNVRKRFFPLTERCEYNPHGVFLKFNLLRKVIRLLELICTNIRILLYVYKKKPEIINYSLTNMPGIIPFLNAIRKVSRKSKIVITCHDVNPFASTTHLNYKKIYDIADYLLVHNDYSKRQLTDIYHQRKEKIIFHTFPLLDLSLLGNKKVNIAEEKKIKILFIGAMRQEKGVDFLVNTWQRFGENFDYELTIAGYKPSEVKIDFSKIGYLKNVKLLIGHLSDDEYASLIADTDYVIFPYIQVGNSGVLSTIASMRKVPITSQLPVFLESGYVSKQLTFPVGDANALLSLLNNLIEIDAHQYEEFANKVEYEFRRIASIFSDEVKSLYKRIIEKECEFDSNE